MKQAEIEIDNYFVFYNEQRKHQSLNRLTPDQVYHAGRGLQLDPKTMDYL